MQAYIDLTREFILRENYLPEELLKYEVNGKALGWSDVLKSKVAIIVAPANFGKTTEFTEQARRLRAGAGAAIFVALRKVADFDDFENALDLAEAQSLENWRSGTTNDLTVFVDSLDEAALGLGHRLEKSLKKVVHAIRWPHPTVKLVISSRPAVLDQDALTLMKRLLGLPLRLVDAKDKASLALAPFQLGEAPPTKETAIDGDEQIAIYSMRPFSNKQAKQYLSIWGKVPTPGPLLQAARDHGLRSLCESPGGLAILVKLDLLTRPPESLTEVFEKVTQGVYSQKDARRQEDVGVPSADNFQQAVYQLASASILCGRPNIELPLEDVFEHKETLSATNAISTISTPSALKYLLGSSNFIDCGTQQVKLFPDELVPYWAACRLDKLVCSAEQANRIVECISWKSPSGEQGVYREFLSLAGWLATLNEFCRQVLLVRDPQAVAFFGDLRALRVPQEDAKLALQGAFQRLVNMGESPGRGYYILTSENYWQAGAVHLGDTLQSLFRKWGHVPSARKELLEIAFFSKADYLREIILTEAGNDYSRILANSGDAEYFAEVGSVEDLTGLATALAQAKCPSETVVAALLPKLAWCHLTTTELVSIVVAKIASPTQGFRIIHALTNRISDECTEEQLSELIQRLFEAVQEWSNSGISDGGAIGRLAELLASLLTQLIERVTREHSFKVAELYVEFEQFCIDKLHAAINLAELHAGLQSNDTIRIAVLLKILADRPGTVHELVSRIFGFGRFCFVAASDLLVIDSPLLNDAVELHRQWLAEEDARVALNLITQREKSKTQLSKDTVEQWGRQLKAIESGFNQPLLEEISSWLQETGGQQRLGSANFKLLEKTCGVELLAAVKAGFGKTWRTFPISRLNQQELWARPNFIHIGLQGLHLELAEPGAVPELTSTEVQAAIQHAMLEFNQVPSWYLPLVLKYQDASAVELVELVEAASKGPLSHTIAERVLSGLSDLPPQVQAQVASAGLAFLCENPWSHAGVLVGVFESVAVERLHLCAAQVWGCAERVLSAWPLASKAEHPYQQADLQEKNRSLKTWAAYWFALAPKSFIEWAEQWSPPLSESKDELLVALAGFLGKTSFGLQRLQSRQDSDGVQALVWFYKKLLQLIRPEDDIERVSGVIYTPNNRDYAQKFRDSIIHLIGGSRSSWAYQELTELEKTTSNETRLYIRSVMHQLQELLHKRSPIPQAGYKQFEQELRLPLSDWMSFVLSVYGDLGAVKYAIEHGEFSLRRFFSAIDFQRIDTDKAGLALEEDFQALLGSELNHYAGNSYIVAFEPQLPEATRRDILCRKGSFFASIELKMSERWTIRDYMDALEKQLVGQYMRARDSKAGFFVVVLQRSNRKWRAEPGRDIQFPELITLLEAKARQLELVNPGTFLRVVGIDATPRDKFRDEKVTIQMPANLTTNKSAL